MKSKEQLAGTVNMNIVSSYCLYRVRYTHSTEMQGWGENMREHLKNTSLSIHERLQKCKEKKNLSCVITSHKQKNTHSSRQRTKKNGR